MNIIHGNLITLALEGKFDVIVHGCNCFNTMGAGIAKDIKKHFYMNYVADQKTKKGDKNKLGTIKVVDYIVNSGNGYVQEHKLSVVNAYTQFNYGRGLQVDYNAVRSCFKHIYQIYGHKSTTKIGYPLIGAGMAGGDWNVIKNIIDEELNEFEEHTVVIFKK